jgi:hypothetical protein
MAIIEIRVEIHEIEKSKIKKLMKTKSTSLR